MRVNLKRCAAATLAAVVLCLGGIGTAFAAPPTDGAVPASNAILLHREGGNTARMFDLGSLVENGTVSQETTDKITAYMEIKAAESRVEMDKPKDITTEERQARFDNKNDVAKTDIFAEMVSAGIITQGEADAIKAAMPMQPENGQSRIPRDGKLGR